LKNKFKASLVQQPYATLPRWIRPGQHGYDAP